MNLIRLGSCLALLSVSVACTQSPQVPTSPSSAAGATVQAETAAADGTTLKVTAPATVSPANGERAEDRNPTLIWLNSDGRYGAIGVAYDIELSSPSAVVYSRTVGESPNTGAHRVDLVLDYDVVYSWRIRARLADALGPWSPWASFMSPIRPVVVTPPPPTTTGPTASGACAGPFSAAGTRVSTRPNDVATVFAVASQFPAAFRNSCQDRGGSWEFMDRTVDALRLKDGRYGYNAKRGNTNDPSHDVVSFYRGADPNSFQGSADVYLFDLIGGHCGSNPSVIWGDVTDITFNSGTIGRTIYPRPGRVVGACTTGR